MTDDRYPVYPKAEFFVGDVLMRARPVSPAVHERLLAAASPDDFMDATERLLEALPEDPADVGVDTIAALDRWFDHPAVRSAVARSGIALPDDPTLRCLPEQGDHFWPVGDAPPHAFQRCACGARRYGERR